LTGRARGRADRIRGWRSRHQAGLRRHRPILTGAELRYWLRADQIRQHQRHVVHRGVDRVDRRQRRRAQYLPDLLGVDRFGDPVPQHPHQRHVRSLVSAGLAFHVRKRQHGPQLAAVARRRLQQRDLRPTSVQLGCRSSVGVGDSGGVEDQDQQWILAPDEALRPGIELQYWNRPIALPNGPSGRADAQAEGRLTGPAATDAHDGRIPRPPVGRGCAATGPTTKNPGRSRDSLSRGGRRGT
jgi:hypothetical protein